MKLLVDIGNHRLKWATSAQLDCRNPGSDIDSQVLVFSESGFVPNLRACLETLDKPEGVWVASVAGDDVNQALTEVVHSAWGLDTVFLRAASRTRGIYRALYPALKDLP